MRDNLLFFGIEEEKGEKDSDCVQKVLTFIEVMKMQLQTSNSTVQTE
jgi:hypothetical protein